MGGNYYKLGRLPKAKYLEIEAELRAFLDRKYGSELYRIPRFYGSKADFGDVDILLSRNAIGSGTVESLKQEIVTSLGIEQYESNGPGVFTTVFHDFQVDFFIVNHDVMESKSSFMAFNDLGNIIGRLFRPFNLKYGERGLYYVYRRSDGHGKREFLVSRDWRRILGFVKLDYDAWQRGFDQIEEMFEWVLRSPYFRSASYLDPDSSIRKKKQRNTVKTFIEYLEEKKIDRTFIAPNNRDEFVPKIEAHFGVELAERIQIERQRCIEANDAHAKFNGNLVMEWVPGLEGKALGKFMREIKAEFSREKLLVMTAEEVEEAVRKRAENVQLAASAE